MSLIAAWLLLPVWPQVPAADPYCDRAAGSYRIVPCQQDCMRGRSGNAGVDYCGDRCEAAMKSCLAQIYGGGQGGQSGAAPQRDAWPGTPGSGPAFANPYRAPAPTPSPTRRPRQIDNPLSTSGRPCVAVSGLPEQRVTSRAQDAVACSSGVCYDLVLRWQATNQCGAPMRVIWSFPGARWTNERSVQLAPGASHVISCRQKADGCRGMEFRWTN